MKYRFLVLLVLSLSLLAACSRNDGIWGKWQLVEYCFDGDCTQLADYDIVQTLDLQHGAGYTAQADGRTVLFFEGRQFQSGMMDNPVYWRLTKTSDTLFVVDTSWQYPDTLLVNRLEADTLVLTSMINNKAVFQRFVRL